MTEFRALLLAAGKGTRLRPYTEQWPKCLMPICGHPLLEYWLCTLHKNNLSRVLVNVHHLRHLVQKFLDRERFEGWVSSIYEPNLLGTAGSLREYYSYFSNAKTVLIHADNWCLCSFDQFLEFHTNHRPVGTLMTMMTFRTKFPESCGIVELDKNGIVEEFYEKQIGALGNLANGAVYILEPEILEWVKSNTSANDFSKDVIPNFLGKIATWENKGIHRDIGTLPSLVEAQFDVPQDTCWPKSDEWAFEFECNPIHKMLKSLTK